MSRLTTKIDNEYIVGVSVGECGWTDVAEEKQYEANQKLGKLEDLEDELKVPLEFILIPYYLSSLKKVWYRNQWCNVVRVIAYEAATMPYMEVRCKDYGYLKFIPLTNYKKTFWLKEDKSE